MANIPFLNNAYFSAKVGIGTDNPGAKLEIKDGDLWLNGATSTYNPEIFFIDDAGPTGIAGVKIRYENNNGNLYFDHKWDTATSGFFFRNRVDGTPLDTMSLVNGKVGIGITTPQAPLSFAELVGTKIDFYHNTTLGDRYGIEVQSNELRIHSGAQGSNAGGITFGKKTTSTFTEAMRITNVGGISFGSTGTAYGSSGQVLTSAGNASPTWITPTTGTVTGTGVNNRLAIWNGTTAIDSDADFYVDGDTIFTNNLEASGNIGITGVLSFSAGAAINNQENTDVDTGTETVANVAIATYTAAFFDFVIKKTTNVRSGTVYACHDGTNVEFTETSTNDLGDTSDVTLSVDISGTNMRLLATVTSDDWSVKSLIRAI